jgi:hypothetical protein
MSKSRLVLAAACALAVLTTGTAAATGEKGGEKWLGCHSKHYFCVNVVQTDRFVRRVEVYQNGRGPHWHGHVGFTSNRLPHKVGTPGNPVPPVVVEVNAELGVGTTLCGEAWETHGAGYIDRGELCTRL